MAICVVAPFMRIKTLKRLFKLWKTSYVQEIVSSGEEGRKKGSEDDLSRASYEIHDGHRPKVLYLKDTFN